MSKAQDYYKRKEIEKYAFGISEEQREELNDLLDAIDVGTKTQEDVLTRLKQMYEETNAIHYLCESCSKSTSCCRNKIKIMSCKLYESEENE